MGKIFAISLAFLMILAAPSWAAGKQSAAPVAKTAPKAAPEADTKDTAPMPERLGRTSSGLPIPRFVSLSSDKVFVRTGPALRYPIKWIYQKKSLPVEVVQEFDTWRKIRDMDGDDGWVHTSLLSGERTGIVKGEQPVSVFKDADETSRIEAEFEPNVVAIIHGCKGLWCKVSAQGYTGYAQRKFLWGIYDQEDFD